MSPTGQPGLGNNPGLTPNLTSEQLRDSAAASNLKAAMGMVLDSLNIPLLNIGESTTKYQSSSNRPVLAPLSTTRGSTGDPAPSDDSWKEVYSELTQLLPSNFLQLYQSAMQLPENQRNPNITMGDNNLQQSAVILTLLRNAGQPLDPDSLAGIRADDNFAKPFVMLSSASTASSEVVQGANSYLGLVGANNANFDNISGNTAAFATIADDLNNAVTLLSNKATESEGKTLLASLYDQISTLKTQYDRIGAGNEFLLLGNMLNAAGLSTAGLLMENPGTASLLIGFSTANNNLNTGSSFSTVTDAIADGIKSGFIDKADLAHQLVLETLLKTTILTTLALGAVMYDKNVQNQSQKDETPEVTSQKNFSQALSIGFLTNAGILSQVGTLIAKESGASESQQSAMAAQIETVLILMLAAPSIKGGDISSAGPMLGGISDLLQTSITKGHGQTATGTSSADANADEIAQELKVYLQQAQIALEDENMDNLMDAIKNSVEFTTASNDTLTTDIKTLNNTAQTVSTNINVSSSSAATTGITQAA